MKQTQEKKQRPAQEQARQPGRQEEMVPEPVTMRAGYRGSGKLEGRRAYITGGDSGIGRAVAVHFAREGADVAIAYLEENDDARETRRLVEAEGRRCLLVAGDLSVDGASAAAVQRVVDGLGGLDVLVNNLAEQHPVEDPEDLDAAQVEQTFRTNVFAYYQTLVAALPHLGKGASVINTGSVTGARGHETLLDYAGTKGAIAAMTKSFAQALASRGIRVNCVAPGPVWTPLIPASFDADKVATFGSDTLLGRAGQPAEIAPLYVLLAGDDGSFITGQVLHVNGGSFLAG
jgi:NAD(P)-dependent dehydrogenase (short-subunit alcohol dehydrogenase family)